MSVCLGFLGEFKPVVMDEYQFGKWYESDLVAFFVASALSRSWPVDIYRIFVNQIIMFKMMALICDPGGKHLATTYKETWVRGSRWNKKKQFFCNTWTIRNPIKRPKTTFFSQLVFTKWILYFFVLMKERKPVDTKKVDSDDRYLLIQRALFLFSCYQLFDGRILTIRFSVWLPLNTLKASA